MKVSDLFEAKDKAEKEESALPVDAICQLLFKKKAGLVKDPKRDKDKDYIGVNHSVSSIKGPSGKPLHLTFDNSTDSGEFELNSLAPLQIEKGGKIDKAIKKLFSKHEVESKKKTNYTVKSEGVYLREIHLGKKLSRGAVKLIMDLIKLLKNTDEVEDDEPEEKEVKKEAPKEDKKDK